jgi:small-conductance mechanosensitive channel
VWDTLKANKIEIPFPQRDMHLRTIPEKKLSANPVDYTHGESDNRPSNSHDPKMKK